MSRTLGMLLLMLVALTGCQPPGHSPVAIVDLDAVARALGRDDVIAQQINAANEQLSSQVLQIAKTLQEQLREQQAQIGEAGEQADQSQLEARTAEANRQLQATQQEARQRAALFRTAVVNEFRNEVAPVAQQIAVDRGARIVLTSAVPTVWFDAEIDITDEVIAQMRAQGSQPRPAAQGSQPRPAAQPQPAEAPAGEKAAG